MRPPRSRLAAFTLVEMLVVIAIIGVLIALLLPAVQKVRMVAARAKSENNLHQLAVATHNYQSAHGTIPDFKNVLDKSNAGTKACASVFTKLLPFIEQNNLYTIALQQGLQGLEVSVPTYISPADGSVPSNTAGFTSYVANYYVFKPDNSLPRSVPDGLSNTILFTERYMGTGDPSATFYNCWAISADGLVVNKQGRTRVARVISTDLPQMRPPQQCSPDPASSPHGTVILTALADGSVRSVSSAAASGITTSPGVTITNWQAALSPASGETVGPDW